MRTSFLLFCAGLLLAPPLAAQPAAEIVSLKGKGDYREATAADWRPAVVRQKLDAGQFVRTSQPDSKMGLLLASQTVLTLQGVSIVQVKAPEGPQRKSILDFNRGTGRFETKTPSKDFSVRTPTGVAAIRGTEWLVQVDDDGRSVFTVVEGEIEIANDLGALAVAANEEGILEKGRAPYKRRIQDARERVQWVSAFTLDAQRYPELRPGGAEAQRLGPAVAAIGAGEISRARELLVGAMQAGGDSAAAYYLLADIELYFGRTREAIEWLSKAAARFPRDGRAHGLMARAYLFADDFPKARESAARGLAADPEALEVQLAAGEVARLDGDFEGARAALAKATVIAPQEWRAWHALGQLYSERSDPRRARGALSRADALSPRNAQVLGELGTVEAGAYDLPRARTLLGQAIDAQPDDFATWTGLGVARLKSGDVEGALEALLKATLLEPRHARAHVYLAVAYWQQGRAADAFAELRTASLHDPKDPLPYQLASMMHSDLLRPGDALAAARESVARLAYVKSLDAIATNLRGDANLGAPLAQMGLEAWALKVAHDSFDPLWAGSHLFLADRLGGKFTSNSELVQGFLTDPLAFGASNRYQTLVSRPGNYGAVGLRGGMASTQQYTERFANVNGLTEGSIAYFAEAARFREWLSNGISARSGSTSTAGLGWKPRDDLGFFLFATRLEIATRQGFARSSVLDPVELQDGTSTRVDVGMHYRPGPDWQVWLKAGYDEQETTFSDHRAVAVGNAHAIADSDARFNPRRSDLGVRLSRRTSEGLEFFVAAEAVRWDRFEFLERDFLSRIDLTLPRLLESVRQDIRDESRTFSAGARLRRIPGLLAEVDVDHTRYDKTNAIVVRRDFVNQLVNLRDDHERERWSPRAGIVFRVHPALTVRAAYQDWLRPASLASLRPSSTVGIVLDERFVLPGGRLERARAQVEWQIGRNVLVTAFGDWQEVDNLYSTLIGVLNNRPDASNLDRLRNRTYTTLASLNAIDGFPEVSRGRMRESGASVNALVTRRLSVFAEAVFAASENRGAFPGRDFPFLPSERYAVGATYHSDHRWFVAAKALRRGARSGDEAGFTRIPAEWDGAVQAYWETQDKRWSVEVLLSNLGARVAPDTANLTIVYRF